MRQIFTLLTFFGANSRQFCLLQGFQLHFEAVLLFKKYSLAFLRLIHPFLRFPGCFRSHSTFPELEVPIWVLFHVLQVHLQVFVALPFLF